MCLSNDLSPANKCRQLTLNSAKMNKIVRINAELISNWDSFHQIFKITFGFPEFYGNNMNAWIDCMFYIDDKEAGMTKFWINTADTLIIELTNCEVFKKNCFDICLALFESVAFSPLWAFHPHPQANA